MRGSEQVFVGCLKHMYMYLRSSLAGEHGDSSILQAGL